MKNQFLKITGFAVVIASLTLSCERDNDIPEIPPPPINESENLTTVKITFTESANPSNVITATFKDPDGDGGNAPAQFDTIKLLSNKTYYASTEIWDDSKNPAVNITEEIKKEQNDHQLFYMVAGADITVTYNDQDTNNPPKPVGLSTTWRSGNVSTGSVKMVLKHQPGIKDENIATGDTDIEITFHAIIQ